MIKKYEFTEETKVICGRRLHRIRALRDYRTNRFSGVEEQ